MQRTSKAAIIARRITGLLATTAVLFLLVHVIAPQLGLLAKVVTSSERIVNVALSGSADLFGLMLLCAAAGMLMLVDRRRRSRVRQASN